MIFINKQMQITHFHKLNFIFYDYANINTKQNLCFYYVKISLLHIWKIISFFLLCNYNAIFQMTEILHIIFYQCKLRIANYYFFPGWKSFSHYSFLRITYKYKFKWRLCTFLVKIPTHLLKLLWKYFYHGFCKCVIMLLKE